MSVPRSSMRSWNIWSICGGAARWARSALRGVVNARKPEEHRKNRGPPDPSDADTVSDRLPRRNLGERPYLLANHGRVLGYGLRFPAGGGDHRGRTRRSEEHTSELQSLMRLSDAVFFFPTTIN